MCVLYTLFMLHRWHLLSAINSLCLLIRSETIHLSHVYNLWFYLHVVGGIDLLLSFDSIHIVFEKKSISASVLLLPFNSIYMLLEKLTFLHMFCYCPLILLVCCSRNWHFCVRFVHVLRFSPRVVWKIGIFVQGLFVSFDTVYMLRNWHACLCFVIIFLFDPHTLVWEIGLFA